MPTWFFCDLSLFVPSSLNGGTALTIREMIGLHLAWRRRENTKPLVVTYAPIKVPFGGFDMDVPPTMIAERKGANLQASAVVPADVLPVAFVDFGTAFLPALAGAGFKYDGHTSWAIPCAESLKGLQVRPFDPEHPLWVSYLERFRPLLDNWNWDTYLPGPTVMLGPMDILAGLLGPENLAMSLYTEPEEVQRCAADAARLFMEVFRVQVRMIRAAGLTEGMADWMSIWLPGEGVCYSEDFSALCGELHFRQFFLEPNNWIMSQMDSAMLHLHSAALPCLPGVLDIKGLKALEISNDPNGPDVDGIIAAAQQVQAAGIPLQVSNWEHPLTEKERERLFSALSPPGLRVSLQARSLQEAQELYAWAKGEE